MTIPEEFKTRLKIAKSKIKNQFENDKENRGSFMGNAFKLGTELVAAVLVGTIIGFILDTWFDTKPWLIIIFLSFDPKNKNNKIAIALININKLALVKDKSIPAIFISGPIL